MENGLILNDFNLEYFIGFKEKNYIDLFGNSNESNECINCDPQFMNTSNRMNEMLDIFMVCVRLIIVEL